MLESSDYLKDDCLKINCTVGVVVSAIDCSSLHHIHVPDSDIGSDFGTLLENMEGSDVTFNVSGEQFHAHKLVLAARSPVFCSEFYWIAMGKILQCQTWNLKFLRLVCLCFPFAFSA